MLFINWISVQNIASLVLPSQKKLWLCKLVEHRTIWRTFSGKLNTWEDVNAQKLKRHFEDLVWWFDAGAFVLWPPRSHERINIHLAKSGHCELLVLASSSTLPFCSPLSAHIKHNHNIKVLPETGELGIVRAPSSGCWGGHCEKCRSTTRRCPSSSLSPPLCRAWLTFAKELLATGFMSVIHINTFGQIKKIWPRPKLCAILR